VQLHARQIARPSTPAVASSIAVRDYAASVAPQPRDSMHYRTPAYTAGENELPGVLPPALYLGFTGLHFDPDPLLYVFPGFWYFAGMMVLGNHRRRWPGPRECCQTGASDYSLSS
jgi:hypothetical protein